MSGMCLGFDTSNYTTSAAVFDGSVGENRGRLLTVQEGSLGLRQSEAVFQHVKRLHLMTETLRAEGIMGEIRAVGASTQPREVEGSYMPCFLVGEGQGRSVAAALGVPFYPCSHQQGHIAAAAWSAGREDLIGYGPKCLIRPGGAAGPGLPGGKGHGCAQPGLPGGEALRGQDQGGDLLPLRYGK